MAQITLKEIAKLCGVSRGTVDRAINDRPGISPLVKEKIMKAIEETGYQPDPIAQSLVRGKTMSLGFVCFDLHNNFIAELVDTIEATARKNGYFVSLVLTHGNLEEERKGLAYLAQRKVDGIILFPVGFGEDYVRFLRSLNIPIVSVYNKIADDIPCVRANTRQAMQEAVGYIAAHGYQRIVFVNAAITQKIEEQKNVYNLFESQKGYEDALQTLQLHAPTVIEGFAFDPLVELVRNAPQTKTAILCICDMFALEVLRYFRTKGLDIPRDAGLMGFDGISTLEYIDPHLTSVRYDVAAMAQTAIHLLLQLMQNKAVEEKEIWIPHTIEPGQSLIHTEHQEDFV